MRGAAGLAAGVAALWTLYYTLLVFSSRYNGVFHVSGMCTSELLKSMFLCHGVGHIVGSWLHFFPLYCEVEGGANLRKVDWVALEQTSAAGVL